MRTDSDSTRDDRPDQSIPQTRTAPSLRTNRVCLEPIQPQDYPLLYKSELSDRMLHRWRFGYATPSPESYAEALWDGVYSQYIVRTLSAQNNQSPETLGLVSGYNYDPINGFCYLGIARFAEGVLSAAMFMEGAALFIDLLFRGSALRKIYIERRDDSGHTGTLMGSIGI
jgi:hypothetical protein